MFATKDKKKIATNGTRTLSKSLDRSPHSIDTKRREKEKSKKKKTSSSPSCSSSSSSSSSSSGKDTKETSSHHHHHHKKTKHGEIRKSSSSNNLLVGSTSTNSKESKPLSADSADNRKSTQQKKINEEKEKNRSVVENTTARLSVEFEDLTDLLEIRPTFEESALNDHNLYKNRYGNVLPNADTIVKLKNGCEGSYINANYIAGVDNKAKYIASQAPLQNTFDDFWLMIWEQRIKVILMLTRLQENNKQKAEIYWPTKGALGQTFKGKKPNLTRGKFESYGRVSVCLEKFKKLNNEIIIRQFVLKWSSGDINSDIEIKSSEDLTKERTIIQIHYEGWPDFGVPETTENFRKMLVLMDKHNNQALFEGDKKPNGPILLHCSAGLGRTGTLIAAHIAAQSLKLKKDLDLKELVSKLRKQRHGMVQTKEQYKFLHQVVKEFAVEPLPSPEEVDSL